MSDSDSSSIVGKNNSSPFSLSKSGTTTCASLHRELQEIWDEIGESDAERDRMLLHLEQECLDIYRKKVERSRKYKADLHQSLVEAEAEIAQLLSALGDQVSIPRQEKLKGSLKQQISVISPTLESLRLKKQERVTEISDTELQIARICAEIAGNNVILGLDEIQVDEQDLTAKKLGELKYQLQELQTEKNLRLHKVNSHIKAIHDLSAIMSLDFEKIITEVHISFTDTANSQPKSISNETLARLTNELNSLKQKKQQRLLKVQDLGRTLIELWDLMDMAVAEQTRFQHITSLLTASANEALVQGCLSDVVIEQIKVEVERLNVLKVSKMKELIFKRQSELEEIYKGVHMDVDSEKARQILVTLVESGNVDFAHLLASMNGEISKAKELAQSRNDILDKVEKWRNASKEEHWLDEYERDQNRYSAGRGVHKNLKRAEKARILVSKMTPLVDSLTAKVKAWEQDKGMPFLYNKAPLLRTLEEFAISRKEKEEEKRRSREQKKLQDQLATEKEALFGTKPSAKKPLGQSSYANSIAGTPNSVRMGTPARHGISNSKDRRESGRVGGAAAVIPINYVALSKEDRGV